MTDATTTTPRWRSPAPASISEQARKALNAAAPLDPRPERDLDDTHGWLRWVESREAPGRDMLAPLMPPADRLARTTVDMDGVPTYLLRPAHVADDSTPIVIELHGGGPYSGGGDLAWMMTAGKATNRNANTWVPDYRMPPLHPYPAALDDCLGRRPPHARSARPC